MLSNAYFLAKIRFDTAENEPAKNLQNFRKMHVRKMHFRKMHFSKKRCPGGEAGEPLLGEGEDAANWISALHYAKDSPDTPCTRFSIKEANELVN